MGKVKNALTFFLCVLLIVPASATAGPRTNPFTPGQTLDPGAELFEPCGPADANCFPAVLGVDDEGSPLTGNVLKFNFVGAGVSAINNAGIVTVTVSSGGLTSLTNGNIYIGNASNIPTAQTLTGDASLSSTGVLTIATASSTVRGLLTSADWNTFNNKVATTRSISTAVGSGLSGGGDLSSNRGLSLDINGLASKSTALMADTIPVFDSSTNSTRKITRSDFLQGIVGALLYQGVYNATTNTPSITDASGAAGHTYAVSVAGTRDFGSGPLSLGAGDFLIHNGTVWQVAPSSNTINTIFGRTGNVTASTGDYIAAQITNIASGTISATDVQSALNELDTEKLTKDLASANIFIGNGSGVATGVALSGDASISNAGVLTISNTAVTLSRLASDAVNSAKIVDDSIVNADINASANIALSKLASGTSIVTSLTTPTGTNANGGSISSNVLTLSLADGANPGLLSIGTQTIAGAKTFTSAPTFSTMTAGSILFGGTAGLVSQNNTNLFWDDANNRLGIGTMTPGSALDVKGTLRLSGATSGFVGFAPAAAAGSTIYTLPSADGTSGQVLSTNASGVLSWATAGGSSQWTTNGSKIYYNTGNVGIGTNDPVDKLQVGDGTADFRLSVMSNTTKQFTAKNASGNSVKYGASTDSLPNAVISNNDDTALMTLLYGGNVGIGTTTPSAKLSITGSGTGTGLAFLIANSSNVNRFQVQDNGNAALAGSLAVGSTSGLQWGNNGSAGSITGFLQYLSNGVLLMSDSGANNFGRLILGGNTSAYPSIKRNGAGIDIRLGDDSGFANLTALSGSFTGSGNSYFTGNVGIGTTTPGSTLDVKGTLRLSGATSGFVGFAPAAAAGSTIYTLPSADGTAGQILSTNASGVLSWATNSGATSLATPTGTNANGGSITNNVLTLSFANGSNPGLVSTGTQTIAGAKTFTTAPTFSSMTAGSVTFAGTAGVVSQDNANLFWDDTNNRLGIGTAVPKSLLTINRSGTEMAASTYDVLRLISNDHPVMRLFDGDGTVAAIGPDNNTFYIGSSGSWTFKNGTTQTGELYNTGTNVATISVVGAYVQASDRREKHDITDLTYGLETVLKLKPSSYVYNIDETNATSLGFIAQDLLNVVPEVVSSNGEGNAQRYAVNYSGLIPVLVKSIQDLNFKVETGFGSMSVEEIEDFAHAGAIASYLDAIKAEGPRNPVAYIAQKMEDGFSAVGDFVAERVTAINGYFENLFAKNIQTENLCIADAQGGETCITKEQLDMLLESAAAEASLSVGSRDSNGSNGGGGAVSDNPDQGAADDSSSEEPASDETTGDTLAETEPLPPEETTTEAETPVAEETAVEVEVAPEADASAEEETPAVDVPAPDEPTTPVTPSKKLTTHIAKSAGNLPVSLYNRDI